MAQFYVLESEKQRTSAPQLPPFHTEEADDLLRRSSHIPRRDVYLHDFATRHVQVMILVADRDCAAWAKLRGV